LNFFGVGVGSHCLGPGTPGLHRGRGGLDGFEQGQANAVKVVTKLLDVPIKLLVLVFKRDFRPLTLVVGEVSEQLATPHDERKVLVKLRVYVIYQVRCPHDL
jgi:hypothetical protein